jgi:hypothetical protein
MSIGIWQLILILLILLIFVGFHLPVLWVLKRAGKSRWQFIFVLIPVVNIIWLYVFAFSRWPALERPPYRGD